MKSQSLEAEQGVGGGGSGVKRRPLHHHQHHPQQQRNSPLLHHVSSDVSLGAGEKKRSTALERRIVFFRRLFHQATSSSRLFAWPILITFMLVPIVIFHTTLPSSSSSSVSSSLSWLFRLEESRLTVAASTTSIEPQSLYGRHYRAVEYDVYTSNQATENKDNSLSFDIHHHITEPRSFPVAPRGGASNKSPVNNNAAPQRRLVKPMMTRELQEDLQDSSAYRDARPNNWETKRCKAQFQWQKGTFMTCNIHHELDMTVLIKNNNNTGKEDDENDDSLLLRLVANVSVIVFI